jgi:hypothetical protein
MTHPAGTPIAVTAAPQVGSARRTDAQTAPATPSAGAPWSFAELEARLHRYCAAMDERDKDLLCAAGGVGFLALAVVLGGALLPAPVHLAGLVLAGAGGIALVVYILATARAWHCAHGVCCPYCHHSLVPLDDRLEEIREEAREGAPTPATLDCPSCHQVVAARER